MSDKLNRKEEAEALQYIKKFLVPFAAMKWAMKWDKNWKSVVQDILKDIRRYPADVPILGKNMTDLIFYKAEILASPTDKRKTKITFRIGKYLGKPVVSYYDSDDLGRLGWESKWYGIDALPDQSIRRIAESFGSEWDGKDTIVPPITKIEEAEALQFIRNVAIPYTIDHIYNVFLAFFPNASIEAFPRIGYNDLKNKLKKWQQSPNSIRYIAEFGKDSRACFNYYIQKRYVGFGVNILIHHQLPMSGTNRTNDVVLYLDPSKQQAWFKKLGYTKESCNKDKPVLKETLIGPDDKSDITRKEEAQAVQWIRAHIFKYVANQIGTTEQQLRDTFKKMGHNNNIWYTSQSGLPNFPEVIYGIYRDEKNGIIVSVDNDPAWHMDFPVGRPEYLADFGKINENGFPSDPKFDISKREEAQALQYIRGLIPKVTKELNSYIASQASGIKFNFDRLTSEKSISKNLRKTEHRKEIFNDRRGPQDYIVYTSTEIGRPPVVFYIYKIERHLRDPKSGSKIAVGYNHFNPRLTGGNTTYLTENDKQKLKESITKIQRISKKEELEALQYIRGVLGPSAVNAWNQRTMNHEFKSEMVLKQLKKISDERPPDDIRQARRNTDYITYSVTIPVRDATLDHKVFFTFAIFKNQDGELMINYYTPLVDGGPYHVGASPLTGLIPPIRENTENPNPNKVITKMDEYRAVDFIKKLIVPLVVKRWNRIYRPHGELNIDKVRRSMKKKEHTTWPNTVSDFVVYTSNTTIPHINIHWEIWKNSNVRLMVGWKLDNEKTLWSTYFVDDPWQLNESVDPHRARIIATYSITKKEEDCAADFIKKRLIPKLVEFINDTSKHWTRTRQITVEEVLKTFKKVGSFNSKHGFKRDVQYQALFLGEPFLFDIFKDGNSKLKVLQKSDGTSHFVT